MGEICSIANAVAFDLEGRRNTCIFTSAGLCDALVELGVPAAMLRVEAAVDTPTGYYALGSFGDGSRRPAAPPGMWNGHVAVIADRASLLDPTLDQVPGAEPFAGLVTEKFLAGGIPIWWFDGVRHLRYPEEWREGPRPTGLMVRYIAAPHKCGWKSKPAFRRWRHDLVDEIVRECKHRGWGGSLRAA